MHNAFNSEIFEKSTAWPFQEACKIIERLKNHPKKTVVFSSGYGPSGLPHIGTFGEALRTTMVRHALSCLMPEQASCLLCVSDDMDGLRKVPSNVPNQDMLKPFIDFPLTKVPDPFEKFPSFGQHNNQKLKDFLDSFGFEYTFVSATESYQAGIFDEALLKVLNYYQDILNILLPTLREDRRKTYSPFLPISPKTGRVLQVPMQAYYPEKGTISFFDEDGTLTEIPVTSGTCKLQWKVDWGMRWYALGVDYEMSGKDLIDSVTVATKVCKAIGGTPPINLTYEHFLDEEGRKISKSVGNGLTMDEWMMYAPLESLSYFLYQTPKRAKRFYFDVIPKSVDDYLAHLEKYTTQSTEQKIDNPVWHIHSGQPPVFSSSIHFSMLLNLASVCNAQNKETLWAFISRYDSSLSPKTHPFLDVMVEKALKYYHDIVLPTKVCRPPTEHEKVGLLKLKDALSAQGLSAVEWQQKVYEIGKEAGFSNTKAWFSTLYETLLGQSSGPRMGTFIALYGPKAMQELIDKVTGY